MINPLILTNYHWGLAVVRGPFFRMFFKTLSIFNLASILTSLAPILSLTWPHSCLLSPSPWPTWASWSLFPGRVQANSQWGLASIRGSLFWTLSKTLSNSNLASILANLAPFFSVASRHGAFFWPCLGLFGASFQAACRPIPNGQGTFF